MFREIRGIEEENIVSAIQGLPSFYFKGGWADEICLEFFRLPPLRSQGRGVTAG